MDEDEKREKRIAAYTIGQETSAMSVEEIDETITALQAEVDRLSAVRKEKSAHLEAAASLFKS